MEHVVKVNLWSTALVLAGVVGASLVTSTFVAARAVEQKVRQQARSAQTITVKGSARQRVESDTATWSATVRGEGKTLDGAYAVLENAANTVAGFLADRGFPPEQVSVSAIDTSTFYTRDAQGNSTREVTGFALTRTFTVTTKDVTRVARAASEITTLLKQGVQVTSSSPEYTLSGLPGLRVQLLGDAAQDARRRAEEIARNTGAKVGTVREVQTGVLQITQPNSTEVSGYGRYDTFTIEKDVSAVVTVTFGVE